METSKKSQSVPSAIPPPPLPLNQLYQNRQPLLIGVVTPFFAIALLLSLFRFYIRFRGRKQGLDDFFLFLGILGMISQYATYIVNIHSGLGRHIETLSPDDAMLNAHVAIVEGELVAYTITFVRISLIFTILRFLNSKPWRTFLYSLIGILLAFAAVSIIMDMLHCRPLRAFWDYSLPRTDCGNPKAFQHRIFFSIALAMTIDIICSLLPTVIILRTRFERRDKIVLSMLMALGLLASISNIPKFISLSRWSSLADLTWASADVCMFNLFELCLGVIAICIPSLKSVFEHIIRQYGLITILQTRKSNPYSNMAQSRQSLNQKTQSLRYLGGELEGSVGQKFETEDTLAVEYCGEKILPEKPEMSWSPKYYHIKKGNQKASRDEYLEP